MYSNYVKSYLLEFKWIIVNLFNNNHKFKRTLRLKNSKKGKSLFLFANGPSLKIISPQKINSFKKIGYEVFCINSFVSTDFFLEVKPDLYHIADPAHFLDFSNQSYSKNHIESAIKDHKLIKSLRCPLFVPVNQFEKIDHSDKYVVTHLSNPYKKGIGDLFTSFGHSTMTAYSALSIALFLGFDHIYICGFDNSWFKSVSVDESNNLYYDNDHFYDTENPKNKKIKISPLDGSNMGEYLSIQQRLFDDLYRFPSKKITNLDPNSLVDAFTKNHDLNVYI